VSLAGLGDANPRAQGARLPSGALVHKAAFVDGAARVGPNVYLGEGTRVLAGATVEDATLLLGAQAREGETLRRVIAWADQRMT
jgi:hypothetical protein